MALEQEVPVGVQVPSHTLQREHQSIKESNLPSPRVAATNEQKRRRLFIAAWPNCGQRLLL